MLDLPRLFVIAVGIAALLAVIAIWSPRKVWVKASAVIATSLFLPLSYAAFADLLSKPKPIDLEWAMRNVAEASVLSATFHEGEAIYLWLQLENVAEPRAYMLPWSQATAEQLQQAQREAENNQNGLRMRQPFDASNENRKPMFYAPPQPTRPAKDGQGNGPEIYRHPGRAT